MSDTKKIMLPATLAGKISLVLIILFVLSLIPLLIMAFYNHPVGDDFTYGMSAHFAWESTHSILEVIKAAASTARNFWYSYQGPFVSAFFMALQPAVISERLYPITTFLMLGALIISTSVFLKVLLRDWYQIRKEYCQIITITLLFLQIQVLPAASEAFYWYCGAVHYVFMHSCMLLLFASMLFWMKTQKKKQKVIAMFFACLFAFMTGGANFATGLLTAVLFVVFAVFCIYYRKKQARWLIIPWFINTVSFYICVSAPGNLVREADTYGLMEPLPSIYQAFRYCLHYIGEWNNTYFILSLIFLLPVLWKAVSSIHAPFPLPGLVLFASFCVLSSTFAPNTYALGTSIIFDRTLNIIMMSYYMLAVLNLFYLSGWLYGIMRNYNSSVCSSWLCFFQWFTKKYHKIFLAFLSACLILMIFFTPHQELSTVSAIHDLKEGYAQSYHQEVLHRIALLTMEGVDEVWVPNYSVRPHLLDLEDISVDTDNWRNQATAQWYGKKIVHLSIVY